VSHNSGRPSRGVWRTCRIYFRWCRIAVWLGLLLVLGSLIYLNQVGLPGFVKTPLLDTLRARGVDLQFSRLRLRWYQGIVAEDVHFGRAGDPASGQLTIGQVQLVLNLKALSHWRLQVDELVLSHGRLLLPLGPTNAEPRQLTLNNIQTELRLLPEDQWALDNFKAEFAGARIHLSGNVTNASAVAEWKFFHGQKTEPAGSNRWQRRLQRLAENLEHIRFSAPPELRLDVRGDARELQSFAVRLGLDAPGAETPWGTLVDGKFSGRLLPADTNGNSRADISVKASTARTRWAAVTNLHLTMVLTAAESRTNLIAGELELAAAAVQTRWARATNVLFSANWLHSITNPVPLSGKGHFQCEMAETKWASAHRVELSGTLFKPATTDLPGCDDSWAWWTNLHPYSLSWECLVSEVHSTELSSRRIALAGDWRAPNLNLTNLDIAFDDGGASVQAHLEVISRRLEAAIQSNFDPHKLRAFLPEASWPWLDQFSWDAPPKLGGQIEVILPPWTNSQPDWRREVQPTLKLAGEFSLPGVSYRQVQVTSVHSHFLYSNLCWHLPDLSLTTPEGRVDAEYKADETTKDFFWHVSSSLDLRRFRALLPPEVQSGFDLVNFTNPPAIECRLWGRWGDAKRLGFRGQVALTNFSFRGQAAEWLQTGVDYTNRVLRFYNPRVQRGNQQASVEGLMADFNSELIFLTNGISTFDPMAIANAIGPEIGRTVQPYHFDQPPHARVEGVIPMHGEAGADLHFYLDGGPFSWWKLHTPQIAGHVHWAGLRLFLEDVRLDLYGGKAAGSAQFDFLPRPQGTDFKFSISATNTLLQGIMADLSSATNHLEGLLNGAVTITSANTESWTSVFGYGALDLRDGLLWDIPLFGILSPVLNGISPGLGNFRAGSGECTFAITNGVIRSDDLQIHSAAVRLEYRGTVDFESRLNARVEAELLRDVRLIGPVVSTLFWPVTKMFEYKVTGTLWQPKLEPVFIVPKIVLMPFHPLRTLKSLLPQESGARTNGPPPVFQDLEKK